MVLLNMDKDKLQKEVNVLSDQLISGMDNIADGGQKPKKGKMMSVAGFNPMAVS